MRHTPLGGRPTRLSSPPPTGRLAAGRITMLWLDAFQLIVDFRGSYFHFFLLPPHGDKSHYGAAICLFILPGRRRRRLCAQL